LRDIPRADHPIEFVGGALALDFSNTVGGTHRAPTHEHLQTYEDLVRFTADAGHISAAEARRLATESERHPRLAADVLGRAIVLREAIFRVFSALASDTEPAKADLDAVTEEVTGALVRARLTPQGRCCEWTWTDELSLERPLWPIARSAVDLLTSSEEVTWVRECASDTCEWLFIDRSRNHTRRWCDMNDCGNRAKVRRLRERKASARTKAIR